MFIQTDKIEDYVFSLAKAKRAPSNSGYVYQELIGTGFFIGNNGFALTAAHVIDQLLEDLKPDEDVIVGMFNNDSDWFAFEITDYEKHSSEDVGIIKLQDQSWKSFLIINSSPQNSSCEYHCWGFPHETAKELKKLDKDALDRPELIFTSGYIRRRISRQLYPTMIFRGSNFYEVSETIGGGASGGPIILKSSVGKPSWEVIGIYIGEKEDGNIGYAVRTDSFADWTPSILKKSIIAESKTNA